MLFKDSKEDLIPVKCLAFITPKSNEKKLLIIGYFSLSKQEFQSRSTFMRALIAGPNDCFVNVFLGSCKSFKNNNDV